MARPSTAPPPSCSTVRAPKSPDAKARRAQRGLVEIRRRAGWPGSARQPAELLAQAQIEGGSGELGDRADLADEARVDRPAGHDLTGWTAVERHVKRLARAVV